MTVEPATGSRGGRRLIRTIVLATVAAGLTFFWLSGELGLDRGQVVGYVVTSLLLVCGFVVLGILLGTLLSLVRRLGAGRDRDSRG